MARRNAASRDDQDGATRSAGARLAGTIKRLVTEKGFGFLAGPDDVEYFFHYTACVDDDFELLMEGTHVTFEKGLGPKGPRAEAVQRS